MCVLKDTVKCKSELVQEPQTNGGLRGKEYWKETYETDKDAQCLVLKEPQTSSFYTVGEM